MAKQNYLEQLSENVYMATLPGREAAIVLLASRDVCTNRTTAVSLGTTSTRIRSWGTYNDLPQRREEILQDNNIVGSLLATKRNITLGAGLQPYREIWDEEEKKWIREPVEIWPEALEFFEKIDLDTFLMCCARNFFMHGQYFPEFIAGKSGNGKRRIVMLKALEAKYIRAEEQDDHGKINNWIFSTQWVRDNQTSFRRKLRNFDAVSAFDRDALLQALNSDGALPQKKFIWRIGDDLFNDGYYYEPAWWGGREWIELANCIPEFHLANLKHGYTIRYHIQYRSDYFNVEPKGDGSDESIKSAQDATKQNRQAFVDKMNKFLAGLDNTGRAVYTAFEFDRALQKEIPGIKIEPVKTDLQDKALIELFEKSNEANISAQGMHPTLANIQTQGKLSSGSEMRIAYQTQLAIHAPMPRKLLLKPINLVHRINGWRQSENIKWGFRDIEITKIDVEKSGMREVQQTQDDEGGV